MQILPKSTGHMHTQGETTVFERYMLPNARASLSHLDGLYKAMMPLLFSNLSVSNKMQSLWVDELTVAVPSLSHWI